MTAIADKEEAELRGVLAGWLLGHDGNSPCKAVADYGADAIMAACEREGVTSLVHARFAEMTASQPVPPELMQPFAARAQRYAARSLLCISEARRIQQALSTAGIPALWLKGIALGQWLYPQAYLRDTADIDLLLPDHVTALRAAEALEPLGYVLPNPHIAGNELVFELLAWSERAQLELDVHWELANHALFARRFRWEDLWIGSQQLEGLGRDARGLSICHALLHASVHRALNAITGQKDRLRWLYDIHLLMQSLDQVDWAGFGKRAIDAGIADPCLDAIRASSQLFATVVPAGILESLEQAARNEPVSTARLASWGYLQRSTWRRLPNLRVRMRWLRQLLVPDLAHLRVRYGADGAGTFRLLLRRLGDGTRRWHAYMKN